jgi:hypothetical protein
MAPGTKTAPAATGARCRNHPDRPGRFFCEKFERHLCEECARCPRPTHCKFRTQCLIRELEASGE